MDAEQAMSLPKATRIEPAEKTNHTERQGGWLALSRAAEEETKEKRRQRNKYSAD